MPPISPEFQVLAVPSKEWPPSVLGYLSKSQFPEPGKEPPFLRGDTPFNMLMIQNDGPDLEHQWQKGIWIKKQDSSGFSKSSERMQLALAAFVFGRDKSHGRVRI